MTQTAAKTAERYIYLADAGNGVFKIGWSRKPTKRARSQVDKRAAGLIHQLKTEHATWFEAHLKRHFASKRIHGEWFRLEPADVEYICGFTAESVATMHGASSSSGSRIDIRFLRLPPAYHEALLSLAKKSRRTLTAEAMIALEEYFEKNDIELPAEEDSDEPGK